MTAALIGRAPLLGALIRRLGRRGPGAKRPAHHRKVPAKQPRKSSPQEALPMLADAIIGSSKSAVAKVFGPPQSAVVSLVADVEPATFWAADTWYYPMPRNGPLAMAIRFSQGSARSVEFVQPPQGR
jgi:hypothetical protein